jgi:electron transfer flavoprotein beta subunit
MRPGGQASVAKEDVVKIVVCLKQVPATDSRIKPADDGVSADLSSVEWVINPYDEYALEEALQLREKHEGEVVVVSVGGDKIEEAMRSALALGADRALVLKDPRFRAADALAVSAALAALVKREEPDLVLCGKQAVDQDQMAVPAMLAERLEWPQATVVVTFEVADDLKSAKASREVEGGHEELEFSLPAVVAAQKGLNEPRYASLKGIMAAKKKPIDILTAEDLGLGDPASEIEVLEVSLPSQERKNRMLEGDVDQQVAELVRVLREEEKFI